MASWHINLMLMPLHCYCRMMPVRGLQLARRPRRGRPSKPAVPSPQPPSQVVQPSGPAVVEAVVTTPAAVNVAPVATPTGAKTHCSSRGERCYPRSGDSCRARGYRGNPGVPTRRRPRHSTSRGFVRLM